MIISILQPGFLPWLGFFEQMALSDKFIYLDDVQYTKKDWRNRNRFKTASGVKMISVPVKKQTGRKMLVNEAMINYQQPWQAATLNRLKEWYGKAKYFDAVFSDIKKVIECNFERLIDLDVTLVNVIRKKLDISVPLFFSSEISEKSSDKNMKIIDICKYHNADLLYDGKAAEDFIDIELFHNHKINVKFQNYHHPVYPQLAGDFQSHLSIIDLLMNCGPASKKILLSNSKKIEWKI